MNKHRHVLIVDDDENVLFVWEHALQKYGHLYNVTTAPGGHQALQALEHQRFDLVITDLNMPGMSGQALTAVLKEQCPNLTVIWLTGYRSPETDAEAQRLAVDGCLDKPLTVDEIRSVVSGALGIEA